jgi:glucokinase
MQPPTGDQNKIMNLDQPNRKAILVNGVPASGKSTIARELAEAFHIPIVELDVIKEALFDVLGTGDRDYNRLMGRACREIIWSLIPYFPKDAALIIDIWFNFPPYDWVLEGLSKAGITRFVEVWCHAKGEELSTRYLSRVGLRHEGHPGKEYIPELLDVAARAHPINLSDVFRVDTTYPDQVDKQGITAWVAERLEIPVTGKSG